MNVVFSDRQLAHAPDIYVSSGKAQPNPELPRRAELLLAAARKAGLEPVEPDDYGASALEAVHSVRYLHFLENIHRRWQYIEDAAPYAMPNVHPHRRVCGYPKSSVGQVGYHVYDGSSPIAAETWDSACWSAYTAIHAATLVVEGAEWCYALSRPPGHHAGRDLVGGFCYLNNAALAAAVLRDDCDSVAVLDIDVHHGNGTQDIFFERADVLTVSIHADPIRFYPFFWGYANEIGFGAGKGYNLNLPLARGTGDDEYLDALDAAITRLEHYRPDALVVALGLDGHESDPFRGFALTTAGFGRIGEKIAALELPTVLVQEGGYAGDSLGDNLASFLGGFAN